LAKRGKTLSRETGLISGSNKLSIALPNGEQRRT
jgi:hypothetical protein